MGNDASVLGSFGRVNDVRFMALSGLTRCGLAGDTDRSSFGRVTMSENSSRLSAPAGATSLPLLVRYGGVCLHPRIRLRGVGAAHTGPLIEEQLHGLTRQPDGAPASRFRMRAAQSIGYVECQLSSAFHLVHSALRHGCFAILPGSIIT